MKLKIISTFQNVDIFSNLFPYMEYRFVGRQRELEDEGSEGNVILVGTDRILGRVPPDDLESFPMRGQEILG